MKRKGNYGAVPLTSLTVGSAGAAAGGATPSCASVFHYRALGAQPQAGSKIVEGASSSPLALLLQHPRDAQFRLGLLGSSALARCPPPSVTQLPRGDRKIVERCCKNRVVVLCQERCSMSRALAGSFLRGQEPWPGRNSRGGLPRVRTGFMARLESALAASRTRHLQLAQAAFELCGRPRGPG